jgi:DNA-binding transcriptional regulator YhcF (GntR family)
MDTQSARPASRSGVKYLDIADQLRREIQSGRVGPNQYLTVAEVAARHRVSPDTASHPLCTLHAEGYLARTNWYRGYRVVEAKDLPVARPGKADAVCRHSGKAADEPGPGDYWTGWVWLPPIRVHGDTRDVLQAQADARNWSLADQAAGALSHRTANPSVQIPEAISQAVGAMAKSSGRTLKAEILYALELHTLRPTTTEPNA